MMAEASSLELSDVAIKVQGGARQWREDACHQPHCSPSHQVKQGLCMLLRLPASQHPRQPLADEHLHQGLSGRSTSLVGYRLLEHVKARRLDEHVSLGESVLCAFNETSTRTDLASYGLQKAIAKEKQAQG